MISVQIFKILCAVSVSSFWIFWKYSLYKFSENGYPIFAAFANRKYLEKNSTFEEKEYNSVLLCRPYTLSFTFITYESTHFSCKYSHMHIYVVTKKKISSQKIKPNLCGWRDVLVLILHTISVEIWV